MSKKRKLARQAKRVGAWLAGPGGVLPPVMLAWAEAWGQPLLLVCGQNMPGLGAGLDVRWFLTDDFDPDEVLKVLEAFLKEAKLAQAQTAVPTKGGDGA